MGVESYLHKYAKVVVCSWLRKKIKIGEKFKGLNNVSLQMSDKGSSPMFNVYQEYPICKSLIHDDNQIVGLDIMWDEWLTKNGLNDKIKSKTRIPTIYELKELTEKLEQITIFDIGVLDNGRLKYIFEIEHTHACTPKKIKFITENKIIGYEISAQKVMEQVKLPYVLPVNREWNTSKSENSD